MHERRRVRAAVAVVAIGVGLALVTQRARGDERAWLMDPQTGDRIEGLHALVDEQAIVVPSAAMIGPTLPSPDREELTAALTDAYAQMRREEGAMPSPFRPTRDPGPTLVVEPRGDASETAVVFLHGYGGSFALQCWMVARAADAIAARTVCPSVGIDGRWAGPDGRRAVERAIAFAREGGATRIVLAGLSNGSVGAARLAARLGRNIDALMLLSGVPRGVRATRLPTLVLHGDRDHMTPLAPARAYAHGRRHVELAVLPGTHFVLIEQRESAREAMTRFLERVAR